MNTPEAPYEISDIEPEDLWSSKVIDLLLSEPLSEGSQNSLAKVFNGLRIEGKSGQLAILYVGIRNDEREAGSTKKVAFSVGEKDGQPAIFTGLGDRPGYGALRMTIRTLLTVFNRTKKGTTKELTKKVSPEYAGKRDPIAELIISAAIEWMTCPNSEKYAYCWALAGEWLHKFTGCDIADDELNNLINLTIAYISKIDCALDAEVEQEDG